MPRDDRRSGLPEFAPALREHAMMIATGCLAGLKAQLRLEQALIRSRLVGRSRGWHPNGILADELIFDAGGNLLSKVVWSENGEELERTTYDHPQDGRRAW